MSTIYTSSQPKFLNKQTEAYALGLAVGESDSAYYFSIAGPNQAVKSIWAGLTANKKKATVYASPWHTTQMRSPGGGMKRAYYKIPNSSYGHIACKWTDPSLIVITHPDGRTLLQQEDPKRQEWLEAHRDQIKEEAANRLFQYIAKYHPAPVLPAWKVPLFDYAQENNGLIPLNTYGDCVAAYIIKPELDNELTWTKLVARMVASKIVTFGNPDAKPKELTQAEKTKLIAQQNDQFRKFGAGSQEHDIPGTFVYTSGFAYTEEDIRQEALQKIHQFEDHYEFTKDNDPYGEHDFGTVIVERPNPSMANATIQYKYFWKIDYYQAGTDYTAGAEEPHIPILTERVLTVMKSEEY